MGNRAAAVLLALAMAGGLVWLLAQPRVVPPIEPGRAAPAFSLENLEGGQADLASLRGKVVLINFWATWCKPCEDEMPAMERLYQKLHPEGFELLAVSVDDGVEEVRAFRDRLGFNFPVLLDPTKDTARQYQSFRYPESYLVDRDGTLIERYIGPREWDAPAYVERIERLLGS